MIRTIIPADELFMKARAVGQYYGFVPLSALTAEARGKARPKAAFEIPATIPVDPTADAIVSFLRQLRTAAVAPSPHQPLFVWHTNIAPGRPAPKKAIIQFHALGADRALADAVVIRALLALARDLYREDLTLRINSMGDKETRARYARELGNFFKKRAGSLPEDCLSCAKRDTLEAAEMIIASAGSGSADDLPAPTEHLSDASRKRFEELLEYLEMTETPYELARDLISRGGIWSESCFELAHEGRRLAWGSRYTDLARLAFPSMPFAATGALLTVGSDGMAKGSPVPSRLRFFSIHIGDEAKRISIRLADEFRRARLPLMQHIGVESLTEQLRIAERRSPPYLLIIGRKEALENTAILRNRATQEDTVVPLAGLVDRLKAVA